VPPKRLSTLILVFVPKAPGAEVKPALTLKRGKAAARIEGHGDDDVKAGRNA
jgi:hypothetical protein